MNKKNEADSLITWEEVAEDCHAFQRGMTAHGVEVAVFAYRTNGPGRFDSHTNGSIEGENLFQIMCELRKNAPALFRVIHSAVIAADL